MAVARPKRLTTVVVDTLLLPIPVQPAETDAPHIRPDAAQAVEPAPMVEVELDDVAELEEDSDQAAIIPRRIAASR
jgi:hypothetical protein